MSHEQSTPSVAAAALSPTSFMAGGGQMGALMRSMDWAKTLLGPAPDWPQSLRTAVSICLSSRFPIVLFWGAELVMIYNDAYLPIVVSKHPRSMGQPGLECWVEVRDVVGPMLRGVLTRAEATWSEDLLLPLDRGEGPREAYFTFTYSPIYDESGGVGGVFCAVVETTERVIEGRRLRLLNALAETTVGKTPAEACAIAAAQIARSVNDVPFALLYLLDEATLGVTLVGTANMEPDTDLSPRTIPAGSKSTWSFDTSARGPMTVTLWGGPAGTREAVVLPIERSGGGRPFGFLVVGLSPMLDRSASYERFHKLLAASVSQAVSDAAAYEEERRRADALAELDRAKTTFFSNVSHEFRTPLTLMLGPLQDMLALPESAPANRADVELLHRNSLRLLKLVNTLLEFSRIEAGRVDAVYEPVDLAALTVELASTFRGTIERAGLRFIVDCPALSEPTYVDREMWEKIVLNLLSNAFKFTFEGSIAVRLGLQDDRIVRFDVVDTGTGIAEGELPRLFERFHRIDGARSRSHEGSGIGLALILELVRLHGGNVGVVSRLGEGTTFSVTIPRGSAHLPESRIRAKRTLPSTATSARAHVQEAERWSLPWSQTSPAPAPGVHGAEATERILFADDNADMRDYVTRLLGERWTVETVGDGTAALARMRRHPPDLILCDIMMPGLDGFALVQAIRADPSLRTLPVIMLSARAGEEEAAKGLSAGANDYIAKPFSARELMVRVASALEAARVAREVRAMEDTQRTNFYRHFMQAPFPIAVFRGRRHVVELANPETLRAWGKGPEIIGMPLEEGVPELRGQPFIGWLDGVFATGSAHEGREELAQLPTGPNGELEDVYFNFVYAPLRAANGSVEGVLLSAFTVTAQVLARKNLESLREAEKRARETAEAANRLKDDFLATMSHELRTPLSSILGWTTLLQRRTHDPKGTARGLEIIERNARAQARLIEDVLDVSRIVSGKLRLDLHRVNAVAIARAALDVVRPAADAKRLNLVAEVPEEDELLVVADADRLQQIIWNLLSNAVKFTPPEGTVMLSVSRSAGAMRIVVADTGQGIARENLPFVFDRFRQVDSSMTRKHGGLGLGLAIVRHLAELHGGTVAAESELGKGATFSVQLPIRALHSGSEEAVVSAPGAPDAPGSRSVSLSGVEILIVDDDADARTLLESALGGAGANVRAVDSARRAFAYLERHKVDVIVSDIGMPEEDGFSFMKRLRAMPERRGGKVPAIALTAYARGEDAARSREVGYERHLAKPADLEHLAQMVESLVSAS